MINGVTFQLESWPSFWRDGKALRDEHAKDKGEAMPDVNELQYATAWLEGHLQILTARDGLKLVGYFLSALYVDPHHSTEIIGKEDAYFLLPEYRKGLTGYKMLKEALGYMAAAGVKRVFVEGQEDKAKIFKRLGLEPSTIVYTKELSQ